MDIELLIAEVFARPALWQTRHVLHHNRGAIDKMWDEVLASMNTSSTKDQVRTKWKYLKDQYRKERKKVMTSRSGDEGRTQTSLWPFFELLHFLKDEINQSSVAGNFSQQSQQASIGLDADRDSTLVKEERDCEEFFNLDTNGNQSPHQTCWGDLWPIPSSNQPPSSSANGVSLANLQPYSRKRKQSIEDSVVKKILLLEEQKLELLTTDKKEEPSEDYHFLMSLLPHFKDMAPLQKLGIRNKMNQVLIDEISRLND